MLPFAYLSGDPGQEYFTDGMVEEIIRALSRVRDGSLPSLAIRVLLSQIEQPTQTLRASNLITRSTSADAHRTAALRP